MQGEPIVVGLTTSDAVKAQARHAVHVGRQNDAVPMDGSIRAMEGVGRQCIGDTQVDRGAFPPAQQRRRNGSVDRDRGAGLAGEVHRRLADGQVKLGARQYVGLSGALERPTGFGPEPQSCDCASQGQALDKSPPRRQQRSTMWTTKIIMRHVNAPSVVLPPAGGGTERVAGLYRHASHTNGAIAAPRDA